jgi:thiamine pyrophosphokinase
VSIEPIVSSSSVVALVGGASLGNTELATISPLVSAFVGVDGGADHLLRANLAPAAVIGDLDSVSPKARAAFADVLCHISEQSTTDFEKTLVRVASPVVVALGFTGGRMDHTLSVLNVMARYPDRAVVLTNDDDVCFLAQIGTTNLGFPMGTRVSVMPLGQAVVSLQGVRWPFAKTTMTPDGFTSPSNETTTNDVILETDGPVLITLPRAHLETALKAAVRAR